MTNKQISGLLKYCSDFLRTFGGAAIFIGLTSISFNRPESIIYPAATATLILAGFFSLITGLYFVYYAEHYNSLDE